MLERPDSQKFTKIHKNVERRVTPSRMSSARSASTATASAPSRAAVPARASAPKPAPGVTVDVVLPAERAIFTLEHVCARENAERG